MGLTIHASWKCQLKTIERVRETLKKCRELAAALPFMEVCPIGEQMNDPLVRENYDATWHGSYEELKIPHYQPDHVMYAVPELTMGFNIQPGPYSESLRIGFEKFAASYEVAYDPWYDTRYFKTYTHSHGDLKRCGFSPEKFLRKAQVPDFETLYEARQRLRRTQTVKLRGKAGWTGHDFCKTVFAAGNVYADTKPVLPGTGVVNFLRCHLGVTTLLRQIEGLPGMSVSISDEGDYETNWSCPDWREADAEKRERVYCDCPASYDLKVLLLQVVSADKARAELVEFYKADAKRNPVSPLRRFVEEPFLKFTGPDDPLLQYLLAAMGRHLQPVTVKAKPSKRPPRNVLKKA